MKTISSLDQFNLKDATVEKYGSLTVIIWPIKEHLSRGDAHTYLATSQIVAMQKGNEPFRINVGLTYKEKFFVNDAGKTILKSRSITDEEMISILA